MRRYLQDCAFLRTTGRLWRGFVDSNWRVMETRKHANLGKRRRETQAKLRDKIMFLYRKGRRKKNHNFCIHVHKLWRVSPLFAEKIVRRACLQKYVFFTPSSRPSHTDRVPSCLMHKVCVLRIPPYFNIFFQIEPVCPFFIFSYLYLYVQCPLCMNELNQDLFHRSLVSNKVN